MPAVARSLLALALAGAPLVLPITAGPAHALPYDADSLRPVLLTIAVDRGHEARVRLMNLNGPLHSASTVASLAAAFPGGLDAVHAIRNASLAAIEGVVPAPRKRGGAFTLRFDPAPLVALGRRVGARTLSVNLMVEPGTPLRLDPPSGGAWLHLAPFGAWGLLWTERRAPVPVGFRVGDAAALQAWAGAIALALLALPWLLAGVVRRRTLADAARHPSGAWFRGMQWLQWLGMAGVLGVVAAVLRSPLRTWLDVTALAALGPWSLVAAAALGLVLAAWGVVPLTFAQHAITQRLRGSDYSRREMLAMTMWQLAPVALIVLAITTGVACLLTAHAIAGLAATLAGLLLFIPMSRFAARHRGFELQALTQGELRDRIAELAGRAGVTVRGVYVLPLRRSRMANAFAVRADAVLLTDWLVEHVERRELDAIVAHELAHLRHHHPRSLAIASMLGVAVGVAATWNLPSGWSYPVAIVSALAVTRFASRRFERVADAEAVKLCGDPEALIRALVRISHLNHVPVQWSMAAERTLTHPSTERRARAIGAAAGLSPERVTELLGEPPSVTNPYPLPAAVAPGGKVFSTSWKSGAAGALGLAMLAAACTAPAFALALARLLGAPRAVATLAAFAASFGAMVAVADAFAARGIRALHSRLARKLAPAPGARYVAVAPGPEVRVYEGYYDWDLGFLSLEPNALVYTGEETTLRLPRTAITGIARMPGPPNWTPAPRVAIAWSDPASARSGVLLVRPADVTRVSSLRAASPALAGELVRWLAAAAPTPEALATRPPRQDDVTGVATRHVVRPITLVTPVFLAAPLSALACAALVLPLTPFAGAGWLEVWLAAVAAMVLMRVPAWAGPRARAGSESSAVGRRAA
jgi:Zn-dependent protease with chaperone function